MKLAAIISILEGKFPPYMKEEWDNVGLQIGYDNMEVNKSLVVVDVTEKAIDFAAANGINLIIAHHPLIFRGINNINNRSTVGKKILKLIENKIALYVAHTNIDAASGGLNEYILQKLGITEFSIIEKENEENLYGIGRYFEFKEEISVLSSIELLKKKLEIEKVKISGDINVRIKKAALVNGSGAGFIKYAKRLGINLFITGDVKYHEALDAAENGITVLDIGHFEAEKWFRELVMETLKGKAEVTGYDEKPVFSIV